MADAKNIWKKAKDSHQYLTTKKQSKVKSGDAMPEDCDVELFEDDAHELRNNLAFLDEGASSSLRETYSLGGDSPLQTT